eukprot:ANDGO_05736.mRNA.1 hypothetical protein EMIHUDRAFT_97090
MDSQRMALATVSVSHRMSVSALLQSSEGSEVTLFCPSLCADRCESPSRTGSLASTSPDTDFEPPKSMKGDDEPSSVSCGSSENDTADPIQSAKQPAGKKLWTMPTSSVPGSFLPAKSGEKRNRVPRELQWAQRESRKVSEHRTYSKLENVPVWEDGKLLHPPLHSVDVEYRGRSRKRRRIFNCDEETDKLFKIHIVKNRCGKWTQLSTYIQEERKKLRELLWGRVLEKREIDQQNAYPQSFKGSSLAPLVSAEVGSPGASSANSAPVRQPHTSIQSSSSSSAICHSTEDSGKDGGGKKRGKSVEYTPMPTQSKFESILLAPEGPDALQPAEMRHYQKTLRRPDEGLYIAKSTIPGAGYGLFSQVDIQKNEIVSEYTGRIMTDIDYSLRYPENDAEYVISVGEDLSIDGDDPSATTLARFANHQQGNRANAGYIMSGCKVFVIAFKFIKRDTEIFTDYGRQFWSNGPGEKVHRTRFTELTGKPASPKIKSHCADSS